MQLIFNDRFWFMYMHVFLCNRMEFPQIYINRYIS